MSHFIVYSILLQCILVSEEDEEATFVEPSTRGRFLQKFFTVQLPAPNLLLEQWEPLRYFKILVERADILLLLIHWMDPQTLTVVFP